MLVNAFKQLISKIIRGWGFDEYKICSRETWEFEGIRVGPLEAATATLRLFFYENEKCLFSNTQEFLHNIFIKSFK